VAYRRFSPLGKGSFNARFWDPDTELPCQQPPWAELMAVNATRVTFPGVSPWHER